eukprot:sb/3463399/
MPILLQFVLPVLANSKFIGYTMSRPNPSPNTSPNPNLTRALTLKNFFQHRRNHPDFNAGQSIPSARVSHVAYAKVTPFFFSGSFSSAVGKSKVMPIGVGVSDSMGSVTSRRERNPPAEEQDDSLPPAEEQNSSSGDDSLPPAIDYLELEFETVPFFTLYLNSGDEMQVRTVDLARVSPVFYRIAKGVENENAGYDLTEYHDMAVRSLIEAIDSEERRPQITQDYFRDILKLSLHLEIVWAIDCCYDWFEQQILAIENITADTIGPWLKEASFIWKKFSNMNPLNFITKRVYELDARSTFVELLCQRYRSLSQIELKVLLVCSECDGANCILLTPLFDKISLEIAEGSFRLSENLKFLLENSCLDSLATSDLKQFTLYYTNIMDSNLLLTREDFQWLLDFRKSCLAATGDNVELCYFGYMKIPGETAEEEFSYLIDNSTKFYNFYNFLHELNHHHIDISSVRDPILRLNAVKRERGWESGPDLRRSRRWFHRTLPSDMCVPDEWFSKDWQWTYILLHHGITHYSTGTYMIGEKMIVEMVGNLSAVLMVFGGALPYLPQYLQISWPDIHLPGLALLY